ncbi:MAG: cell division protein FtsA [Chloroflexi bacterium]|nr:MAG: cell division protein FtsA [Chloroflexota bacterium]TMF76908.1 MAG: cell division protein FtsA [Chloroflexota bacterium]TMF79604.1 MAG: cell division protein FtsA [Chloroflexota bacterium]TMF94647.1 MAG: cell division protein FtsA [Chloroflexota bacterium]TMG43607.1 MAG: cell division protein FtsA [Chloroflexota bacterium]
MSQPQNLAPQHAGSRYNPGNPPSISTRSRRRSSTVLSRRKKTVGLDLGTSRVAVVIAESDDPGTPVTILGVGESPSDGLRKGVVVNLDKTITAIQAATVAAERMAGQRIESVVVSLGGTHLWSQNSTGVVAVAHPDHEIGEDDVHRVVEASRAISVASDRQVIHVIPRAYTVDGQDGVRDAVGMTGHRLEVETNILTGAQTAVQNVIKCVHGAGFDVEDVVCAGLAAGEGILSAQEIELGVCLVEIGAGTTNVVVFNEGSARHLAVLPVGGNHVTSDIAIGLRTTLDEAENLKLNYGHALPDVIDHAEKVEVRQVGGDRIQALPRRFLAEIIGPRMLEIFQMAREEVRKTGFDQLLPAGVVVAGGGSRLMGTMDAAQAVFNTSARLGQPLGLAGLADKAHGPSFAVVAGLVKWGARSREAYGNTHQPATFGNTYQKTVRWLRDFF